MKYDSLLAGWGQDPAAIATASRASVGTRTLAAGSLVS